MAMMMDIKPTEYKGEALVWEKFCDHLPNDAIVYNHREVIDDREFDFAILIKNIGLLVVEVKGWQAKYIFDVKNPDEIIMQGEEKPLTSPYKQARGYRFDWLNFLQDKFGMSPVVLSAVCYPFITEKEFFEKRLDIVSPKDFTIFSEDLMSADKLGKKINGMFLKRKPLNSTPLDENAISIIRQHFEPSYKVPENIKVDVSEQYSILKVFDKNVNEKDIDELIRLYFAGTKIICFFRDNQDLNRYAERLTEKLKQQGIKNDKDNLKLIQSDDVVGLDLIDGKLRIFNLEAYVQDKTYTNGSDLIIIEGTVTSEEEKVLIDLSKATGFNYQQYNIEHAPIDKNILVQAGAGTGKTYSMVSRIAFLCNKRQKTVSNMVEDIAMVTFTNEAADNMKSRLKQYFMNCYILTRNKKVLHQIEAIDMMQISTIHKFAKSILQRASIAHGLGCDFAIASGNYAKEQIYEKYLDDFLIKKQAEDHNFAQYLQMPVRKFKKLLMLFSGQLYNKSFNVKELEKNALGEFEAWPFFNDVIMDVIVPAEKEYEESLLSKNKLDLKESMIMMSNALKGAFKEKCDLNYKYLFVDEFQDTDDVQISAFLDFKDILKDMALFVVGDLKQSIYRFRGATVSAFEQVLKNPDEWMNYELSTNYRTDYRLLNRFDNIFVKMGNGNRLPFIPKIDTLYSSIESPLPNHDLITRVDFSGEENRMDLLFSEIKRQKDIISYLTESHKLSAKEKIIAILVRENWQIHNVLEEAKRRNIFIETEVGGDLYQLEPALDLYKLVVALLNPREPEYLYSFIKSNYIDIELDIQGLHGLNKEEQSKLLIDVLNKYFEEYCGKTWDMVVSDTRVEPILMLLRKIYLATQPWKKYDKNDINQKFYKANYELILEKIIKTYSVDYLTLNVIENSLHIGIMTKQEEMARNIEVESDEIRVICTTVHKAKGLEYGTVILPYMDFNIGSMRKADLDVYISNKKLAYGIKIGKDPEKKYNSNYDVSVEKNERINEEARVFYVALTRTIRNIIWFKNCASKNNISWQTFMEV